MSIQIITDSYSSISQKEAETLGIWVIPMPFVVDGNECFEDVDLSRTEFFQKLSHEAEVSTSQPSPAQASQTWDQALSNYDEILYFPLSSGLSGSCATATMLAQEEPYAGRVFVVDHGRIATPLHCMISDAVKLVEAGYTASQIKEILERYGANMSIYLTVNTLDYLKKSGRISSATAAIGTLMNIKPILQLNTGILTSYKRSRGMKQAKAEMIQAIRRDLTEKFSAWHEKGAIHLLTSGSADEETTAEWIQQVSLAFPEYQVQHAPLSLGVCCHTGEGALGIGISCIPDELTQKM